MTLCNEQVTQTKCKQITELNDIVGQIDLADDPRAFFSSTTSTHYFQQLWNFFTKLDHLPGNETNHNNAWKLK